LRGGSMSVTVAVTQYSHRLSMRRRIHVQTCFRIFVTVAVTQSVTVLMKIKVTIKALANNFRK